MWLENEETAATVDLANTAYMLMLRLISHSYLLPRPHPAKALCVDLGLGLMRAMTPLAERAARLPAGPSNPDCNGGMSFTALRDAAPLPPGVSAGKFFLERLRELLAGAQALAANGDARVAQALRDPHRSHAARRTHASRTSSRIRRRCAVGSRASARRAVPAVAAAPAAARRGGRSSQATWRPRRAPSTVSTTSKDAISRSSTKARSAFTRASASRWGPKVFIANVKGPWINPDAMSTDALTEIAHVCVSGAIRYKRKDGQPDEGAAAGESHLGARRRPVRHPRRHPARRRAAG